MILDIFSELQQADGGAPGDERRVYLEAIEEAKLADEKDFGCWWTVEHHGAPRFSYSSSPEMMLAVLSQHTERIHLGHAGVLAPFQINHPVRVAEHGALVDVLSNGRLELGLARSGGTEWDTFEIDPETSRDQLREALRMVPRMWTEQTFSWKSEFATIPERNIVPKPVQQPHPPLWQTTTSEESFFMAGELGVGMLGTTLISPLDSLSLLLAEYERGLAACKEPAGQFVNAQKAVFTFMLCAESRQQAIEARMAESILWFINAAPTVFQVPREVWIGAIRGDLLDGTPEATASMEAPEVYDDLDLNDPVPVIALLNQQLMGEAIDPVEAYEVLEQIESIVIGDVDACYEKLARYREIGCDRLMCLMKVGHVAHADVMTSIRLTGDELIPRLVG